MGGPGVGVWSRVGVGRGSMGRVGVHGWKGDPGAGKGPWGREGSSRGGAVS